MRLATAISVVMISFSSAGCTSWALKHASGKEHVEFDFSNIRPVEASFNGNNLIVCFSVSSREGEETFAAALENADVKPRIVYANRYSRSVESGCKSGDRIVPIVEDKDWRGNKPVVMIARRPNNYAFWYVPATASGSSYLDVTEFGEKSTKVQEQGNALYYLLVPPAVIADVVLIPLSLMM
jgi:hypothetical protein